MASNTAYVAAGLFCAGAGQVVLGLFLKVAAERKQSDSVLNVAAYSAIVGAALGVVGLTGMVVLG